MLACNAAPGTYLLVRLAICPRVRAKMQLIFFAIFLLFSHCLAAPAPLGLKFEKRDVLPTLTLPYATYRASNYNPNGDVSLHEPSLSL